MASIPDEHRELLAAIADTLDIPLPATYDARYYEALSGRAARVVGAIGAVMGGSGEPWHAALTLRRLADEEPVTYPTKES